MKSELVELLKKTNKLIPSYLNKLKRDGDKYLCPKCNKPLTYMNNTDHIECDYCGEIHGYINLIMYNENLDFKTALNRAKNELSIYETSIITDQVKDYKAIDKRLIGITYLNNRMDNLSIYKTNYEKRPLIFTDYEIGDLIYTQLLSVMEIDSDNYPNIIAISHYKYVFNALSILFNMKKNHSIKIYIIMENKRESNILKKELINQLIKRDFTNFIIEESLINHDLGEHKIIEHYKNNKENFKYQLENLISKFNAFYKKDRIKELRNEKSDLKSDNHLSNKINDLTPKTPQNA